MKQPDGNKLWSANFIGMLVLGSLASTSFYMINPIISKYSTMLGATLSLAGVIAGLFSITALVARPLGAVTVDRLNKKVILAISTAVMGLASLGYAISTNVPLLVLFRVLHGVSFAVSGTATTAMIASIVPRERMGEGIGYYGMGSIIATAIGPNLGLAISQGMGYQANFLIAGATVLLAAFLMTRLNYVQQAPAMLEGPKPRRKIAFDDLISLKVLPLALIGGIFSFTNGIVTSFLVMIGDQRHIANIGLYFTVLAACLFIVRPFTGKLADRKGLAFTLYPGLILIAAESALLAHAQVLWVVLVAAVVKAFGQGAAQPTVQAACLKKLDPSKSGVAAATYFIGADIGQGVGPMIGGSVSQAFGYTTMFYCCIGIILLGMAGFACYRIFDKRKKAAALLAAAGAELLPPSAEGTSL